MKKKVISCLLAVLLMTASLMGCGGKAESDARQETQKSESAQKAEEESEGGEDSGGDQETASKYQTTYGSKTFDNVKITVELFDRSNAPDGSTITENKWTEYVNQEMQKVGITVEFVPVPRWDEVTKMQAMVASQTAPDLTLTYT